VHGANRDFVISYLDSAARVLQKRSVPTVRLHAPGSDEDAVFHHDNPDTDEAVLAGTGPDVQTFALPENSQDVIGKLSLRFHSRTRLAACCSEREHASFGSLLKRIGRYGKTPSERFHCPEMILFWASRQAGS
jgi:hypothetical protein